MGLFRNLAGEVRLRLTGADITASLTRINAAGILLRDVEMVDELTVCLTVLRKDYRKIASMAKRRGDTLHVESRQGLYWEIKRMMHRPVLVFGILFLLMLSWYVPSRICIIEVEGNTTVPTNLILEKAAECGISFGASRKEVRSERVKNSLLEAMPELSWAGVNTYGCRTVITVRQREPEPAAGETGVADIVASRDGYILSCDVLSGNGLCHPGQAVQAGDVLISGYTDCGICITATRASGEVVAATRREITAVTPAKCMKKTDAAGRRVNYSLIVGKNRINFNNNSGISDASCGRMETNYHLTLPGGYRLPVTLVAETVTASHLTEKNADGTAILSDFPEDYLKTQMIAGTVTAAVETITEGDGLWLLTGDYACTEMIGRVRAVQNGELHETD